VSILNVRGDELASLSAAGGAQEVPASRLRVSRRALIAGAARAKELHNFIFYCYIYVLLVKTNTMIYNMLYKLCSYMCACCRRRRARHGRR